MSEKSKIIPISLNFSLANIEVKNNDVKNYSASGDIVDNRTGSKIRTVTANDVNGEIAKGALIKNCENLAHIEEMNEIGKNG